MPTAATNSENTPRGRGRSGGHGRGRGRGLYRGRGRSRGRGGAVETSQPTVSDSAEGHSLAENTPQDSSQSRPQPQPQSQTHRPHERTRGQASRGNREGRASRRKNNGSRATDTRPVSGPLAQIGGRTFGGRLTRDDAEAAEPTGGDQESLVEGENLRADAPEFHPDQRYSSHEHRKPVSKTPKPRARQDTVPKVTTKSIAHDIATRTHEDIANSLYECPICTNELSPKSRVWSCHLCWTVFHIGCVKKWSKNEGSAFRNQEQPEGENDIHRQWRCPGCNLPQDILPTSYSCWCEKEIDPRPLPGIPPHSCGQTCSRMRKGCPHPCDSTCHAGPCAPCTAMGPTQDCFCGKNSSTKRCTETNYISGWSCSEVCGDLLPCGKHTCPRPCHEGFCGACEEKVDARCYCGKVETQILCSVAEEEITSQLLDTASPETPETPETWLGSFRCRETCNRPFDCGVHFCKKECHPQDANRPHCPQSPDVVLRCPCGKTPLTKIKGFTQRTSCEDPIPNCSEPCGKTLPCGHPCPMICHTGACQPCLLKVSISCRCGRGTFSTMCHQGNQEPPQCFRVCKATMNCGRHTCMEHCCPGERHAIERQATKRKLRSLNASQGRSTDNDIEAEHICTRVCGRILKCGRHTCPELCHKGACNSCREAIFEEIPCHCGRSVLYPPQPCGTRPPPCRYDCERPKPCHHPQTPHNCHTDDEECPKCPFLTEKSCLCGKKLLKNQPCWLNDGRCGMVCGEPLKCGSHTCQKQCHRPGECEDASEPCKQLCGKTKKLCGHPCSEQCHAPFACSEKEPCLTTVMITCPCGRLRKEKRCNANRAASSKGQSQRQESPPPPVAQLKCDDECARLERNRTLASALKVDIDPSTTLNQHSAATTGTVALLPYAEETLDIYVQLSSNSPLSTLQDYEATLHSLATSNAQRSVRFQPAKAPLRAFVHALASDWGFASESFDPEPHRHVFVLKPTQWNSPGVGLGSGIGIRGMTVGECVRIRDRELYKEREARRLAAAEAKALREASKASTTTDADGSGGWAQVASRRKQLLDGTSSGTSTPLFNVTRTSTPTLAQMKNSGGSMYTALSTDFSASQKKKKDGLLVLRSGVGASKSKKAAPEDLPDSWEEQVEKEQEEEERQSRSSQEMDRASTAAAGV
jgi:transcriptional repressor NF-X1